MITITLDSSQISTHLTCGEKWNLAYNEHLRLADAGELYLTKGSYFHKLLEVYYKIRIDGKLTPYAAAHETLINIVATEEDAEARDKLPGEIYRYLVNHFRKYVINYAENDFNAVRVEGIPSTEVGFSIVIFQNEHYTFVLEGKIDLLALINYKDLIFVDHKTQGRKSDLYNYTPQFLTYAMVTKCNKAVVNYIRFHKDVEKNTFERKLITFAPHQIEQWQHKVIGVFWKVAGQKALIESGNYDAEDFRNKNSCGGAFQSWPCPFTILCELNPANTEMTSNLKNFKYVKKVWTPWSLSLLEE